MSIINCVLLGDAKVGKTSMINRYLTKKHTQDVPIIIQFVSDYIIFDDDLYELAFWDTPGEDYDFDRLTMYPDQEVFLICFSVIQRYSFKQVLDKWYQEVRTRHPNLPIILVGTQIDLRDMPTTEVILKSLNTKAVSYQEGVEMAHRIGAVKYVECSSVTGEGVSAVFMEVIPIYLKTKEDKEKKRLCLLQ